MTVLDLQSWAIVAGLLISLWCVGTMAVAIDPVPSLRHGPGTRDALSVSEAASGLTVPLDSGTSVRKK